ncbi:MAG: hypothetical protein QOJ00_1142 [Actinomycetota bacterium]|jgi:GAF domain-containing protein
MSDHLARAARVVHQFTARGLGLGDALTELCEVSVPATGADMAGMTLTDEYGRARTRAFTKHMVTDIEEAQYASGRGPCLEAARTHAACEMQNAAGEERWPEFAERAAGYGICSTLSVPMLLGDRSVGALNLYRHADGPWDQTSAENAQLIADLSVAVAEFSQVSALADNLSKALESRGVIEQAKGVVMATTGVDADSAFGVLRQQSQSENRKLREIAEELVGRQRREQ